VRTIGPTASVGVTNKTGPHVSGRRHVYFYGQRGTEYVLLDEKELKADRLRRHKEAVSAGRLVEISRHQSLALFKAQKPPAKPDAAPTEGAGPAEGAAPPEGDSDEKVDDVLGDSPKE
jgi:hypothetical protein